MSAAMFPINQKVVFVSILLVESSVEPSHFPFLGTGLELESREIRKIGQSLKAIRISCWSLFTIYSPVVNSKYSVNRMLNISCATFLKCLFYRHLYE